MSCFMVGSGLVTTGRLTAAHDLRRCQCPEAASLSMRDGLAFFASPEEALRAGVCLAPCVEEQVA